MLGTSEKVACPLTNTGRVESLELSERVAIVTGGSSGIGRAIVELLAKEGAKVVIADVNSGQETVKAVKSQGGTAAFIRTDVRDSTQVQRLVEQTVAKYGGVDIVCNNAGIDVTRNLVDTSEEEWGMILDTNLKGPFLVAKYALPHMTAKKRGVVINIASQMGHVGAENLSAYCASKAGLIQLTKVIALEYAKFGIRANCISPGPIQTPGLEQTFSIEPIPEEAKKSFIRKIPLSRFGGPEEVARTVLFLASDRSSYITGVSLLVDGGYIIQ